MRTLFWRSVVAAFCVMVLAGCAHHESEGKAEGAAGSTGKGIAVVTSRNVELFGILMQLDLAPDALANEEIVELDGRKARWRDWYQPAVANYQRFKQFETGAMMKHYRELLQRGIYNDLLIGFLLQAEEVPKAKLTRETDDDAIGIFSKTGNMAEARREAERFLEELNRFAREIDLAGFMREHEAEYEAAREEVRRNTPDESFIKAMEDFYGASFAAYRLMPSLTIPTSMGFGKTHWRGKVIYNVFGPFTFQNLKPGQLDMGFNSPEKIRGLSTHEFGHSFVNPVIDRLPEELIRKTEARYGPIEEAMKKQAYPTWRICLAEHFVRAGEALIARRRGDEEAARRILAENQAKSFIYLPRIVEQLESQPNGLPQGSTYEARVRAIVETLQ